MSDTDGSKDNSALDSSEKTAVLMPLSQGLSTLQNELNWSQIVIEAGLSIPLSYRRSLFLVPASMKSTLC